MYFEVECNQFYIYLFSFGNIFAYSVDFLHLYVRLKVSERDGTSTQKPLHELKSDKRS